MIARLFLVAVLLAGCESASIVSAVPSASAGGTDPTPGSSASAASSATGPSNGAAAPDVPSGMPVFPGATAEALPPDAPWAIAAWSAESDGPGVYAYYLEQLPSAGYAIDLAAPGGSAAIIRFTTPDGGSYQLDLTGGDPVRITLGSVHD